MSPRLKRYKLLLDEMFPRREKLPQLNRIHDVKHILHDLKQAGTNDEEIIALAKRQQRIIITKNIKDFRAKCRKAKVDMVGVTETIPPEELDISLTAYLRRRKQKKMSGQFKKVIRAPRKK